jgi:hypothetical protein
MKLSDVMMGVLVVSVWLLIFGISTTLERHWISRKEAKEKQEAIKRRAQEMESIRDLLGEAAVHWVSAERYQGEAFGCALSVRPIESSWHWDAAKDCGGVQMNRTGWTDTLAEGKIAAIQAAKEIQGRCA